jgi:hypothetical protein
MSNYLHVPLVRLGKKSNCILKLNCFRDYVPFSNKWGQLERFFLLFYESFHPIKVLKILKAKFNFFINRKLYLKDSGCQKSSRKSLTFSSFFNFSFRFQGLKRPFNLQPCFAVNIRRSELK